uniref:Sodium/bile acid cotransporter n=1 Tax=Alexandrium monilatum TaxID=311494 RepID=A0A7S4S8C7_9DINO|mmetsp:Transcript_94543/g.282311  ORF Transcript_94543/g.282311 Transcript_94543/m.282311 type:complete len:343 (-) Transcript_94543:380-1408(-)
MGKVQDFVIKNFLILGLLTVITFGLICPQPGLALNTVKVAGLTLPNIAIDVIFVISGLALESFAAALQYKALFLGMSLVLVVTPLLAYPILYLPALDPNLNTSLLQGMALFCVVPTTLSSGVTMITQAKGNVSLAILLTSVTNVLGVFTMSFSASKVFSASIQVSPWEMLHELVLLTLVPLCIGMALRRFVTPLREFAKRNKKALGISQNSCILVVVLLMISKAQPEIFIASKGDLTMCLTLAATVHLIYRVVGYFVATAARLPPEEWVTIVLMCSQKSLPVCVSVLEALPTNLRAKSGLFILPCVMAHAAQLIIDSILAVRWQVQAEKVTDGVTYAKLPGA